MCFKSSYRLVVGINAATYSSDDTAIKRIQEIHRTTRKTISPKSAENLWEQFFKQLFKELPSLPSKQKTFDEFAVEKIFELSESFEKPHENNFGIAQKMFNLFMKDHWALDGFLKKPKLEAVLHLPLDSGILKKITDNPWRAFTKVIVAEKNKPEKIKCEYLCIQKRYRDYWRRTGLFASPIEMEQFLWHQI